MSTISDLTAIKNIFEQEKIDSDVIIAGWVRSIRKSKKFSFIVLNDGSISKDLQIVVDAGVTGFDDLKNVLTGSSLRVTGRVVASQGKGQSLEVHASLVEVLGIADETYPLQKKATSVEFLRENSHLRSRTRLFSAIFKIRHRLSMATHQFFSDRDFTYIHTPILTTIDAEGAGEMFRVSTLDFKNIPIDSASKQVDFTKDYFGKEAQLAVTGQLEAECMAMGLGKVYTFGPTFRSENSNTTRHLSEFWMIEPEMAFYDLEQTADLASEYVKCLISSALEKCSLEMEFLTKYHGDKGAETLSNLNAVVSSTFKKISYTEAIEILTASEQKFEYSTKWGEELHTEHERYLTDIHFKTPVIVTDYPKTCKAFYMKQNEDQKTVRAMDVLVPGVGEIIGGSQREEDLEKLIKRMDEMEMDKKALDWYLDLRRYGSVTHSGFGLGLERILMYITGMENVRDVIPFHRTPLDCSF